MDLSQNQKLELLEQKNKGLEQTIKDITHGFVVLRKDNNELTRQLNEMKENVVVLNDLNNLVEDLKNEITSILEQTPRRNEELNAICAKLTELEKKINELPDIKIIEKTPNSRIPKLNLTKTKKI